jgi:hypothetical protein
VSEPKLIGRVFCILFLCAACGSQSHGGDGQSGDGMSQPSNPGGNMQASTPSDANKPSDSKPAVTGGSDDKGSGGSAAPSKGGDDKGGGSAGTMTDPADTADAGLHMMNMPGTIPSARGKCDLHTQFAGDDACLAVPDPDKGFQIHVGPSNYDDMNEVMPFLMDPAGESDECFFKKTTNDKDIKYFVWELSGRPGTHHIINTTLASDVADGFGACEGGVTGDGASMGSLGGASRSWMPPSPVAPENEDLGIPLPAHTQVQHDMHYFNVTDKTILREWWMNIYYVDESKVKETPSRIAGLGGLSWNYMPIQPGTHDVFKYECAIDTDGRIIQLLGHTHAHGIRETAHIRNAAGERLKVFEQYDYLSPAIFNFDSLTKNPDFSDSQPGAFTGILNVKAGDTLEWECEINNDSDKALAYTNEVHTGEMCNIWGSSVGPTISCFLQ